LNKSKLYTLTQINNLQNCRVYKEGEVSLVMAFYSELEVYFNQCFEKGYNIYILYNQPIHNIIFDKKEVGYISIEPCKHKKESIGFYFSKNLKYIKENQYLDYK
jgi:hypothetical protein